MEAINNSRAMNAHRVASKILDRNRFNRIPNTKSSTTEAIITINRIVHLCGMEYYSILMFIQSYLIIVTKVNNAQVFISDPSIKTPFPPSTPIRHQNWKSMCTKMLRHEEVPQIANTCRLVFMKVSTIDENPYEIPHR